MDTIRIRNIKILVTCPGRNYVLVKIETTEPDLYGWGDATLNGRELAVAETLEKHITPLLIGRDVDQIEDIWQFLFRGTYWRGGPVLMTALAGIDLALWDIKGKRSKLPVYSLLGGKTRDGALAYSHCNGRDFEEVSDQVHQKIEQGFQVVRAQVGIPGNIGTYRTSETESMAQEYDWGDGGSLPAIEQWEPRPYLKTIPKLFEHLRVTFGDELELLHDVHERLTPIQAAHLAKRLEPYDLFFLEDPIRPEHKESFRQIRQHTTIPIAMGELFTTRWDSLPLITEQLIDYVRCDLGHIGGISEARKIAAIAESFYVQTAWHGPPDIAPITHAANVHLDVSIANFGVQEMTFFPDITNEVIFGGPDYRDGKLYVSDRPGLGTDIDENKAKKYPYQRAYLPTVRRRDGSVHDW